MRTFAFRAAAALALRRRQEDEAATRLARAEADIHAIDRRLGAAHAARDAARARQRDEQRAGVDEAALAWHRNWITRLASNVGAVEVERSRQALVVAELEIAWRNARRRRLVLERLEERGRQRFARDERRREQIDLDELARLRYTMPELTDPGDPRRDD